MSSLSTTSLANYIALTSGYTGHEGGKEVPITSNSNPSVWPQDTQSIFGLIDAGRPATAGSAIEWAESMPSNCYLNGAGDFVNNHAPFRYYTATQSTLCPDYSRPFSPNSTVSQRIRNGDNWAKAYLPALLASPTYRAGRTAIILTWDEGNNNVFTVPFIVITPYTTVGGVSTVAYDHYSALKGIEQMIGVGPLLGHAADVGKASIRDDAIFRLK
jgi:hypothetical protein